MTFDSHSLERLKELGRKLPKEIAKPPSFKNEPLNNTKKQKLHPVEIETNPEKLFQELMEISPDGNVPVHLLDRLKKLESNTLKSHKDTGQIDNNLLEERSTSETPNLYSQFKQLLLEDEIN